MTLSQQPVRNIHFKPLHFDIGTCVSPTMVLTLKVTVIVQHGSLNEIALLTYARLTNLKSNYNFPGCFGGNKSKLACRLHDLAVELMHLSTSQGLATKTVAPHRVDCKT